MRESYTFIPVWFWLVQVRGRRIGGRRIGGPGKMVRQVHPLVAK